MARKYRKKENERRKALKTLVAGTGAVTTAASVPTKWSKPVIESVVLPAHAQTSAIVSCNIENLHSNDTSNTPSDQGPFGPGLNVLQIGDADNDDLDLTGLSATTLPGQTVQLSINSNSATPILEGNSFNATADAVNGIATFPDLTIGGDTTPLSQGDTFTFTFSAGGATDCAITLEVGPGI